MIQVRTLREQSAITRSQRFLELQNLREKRSQRFLELQNLREKRKTGGNGQTRPPRGKSKKNATQFFLSAQTMDDERHDPDMWRARCICDAKAMNHVS